MGGSGGRGPDWQPGKAPKTLQDLLRGSSPGVDASEHEGRVNAFLGEILSEFNDRDVDAIRSHVEAVSAALEGQSDETVELVYGGSVRKHTYVNGLSDVDLLVLLRAEFFQRATPKELLTSFAARLRDQLTGVKVTVGQIAVTLTFTDGHILQVLPAVQTESGVRIGSNRANRWSTVVRPDAFARTLTRINQSCGGRVVPVIKLFKGLVSGLADEVRPTGYHIESLAIEAFRDYTGDRSYRGMLRHLCGYAQDRVLKPLVDRTGQSLHVDDYLGPAGSPSRSEVSASLRGCCQKMTDADAKYSLTAWEELFGD